MAFWEQPFWIWTAVAAALLALEVATGSGYLLWACGSAAIVAVLALAGVAPGWGGQALLFAGLSIGSTLLARRLWRRRPAADLGPDINGIAGRLVGMPGEVLSSPTPHAARVFVDGKEWNAEAEGQASLSTGGRVQVTAVLGGSRLRVRPV